MSLLVFRKELFDESESVGGGEVEDVVAGQLIIEGHILFDEAPAAVAVYDG
jgi:hypothetical protein